MGNRQRNVCLSSFVQLQGVVHCMYTLINKSLNHQGEALFTGLHRKVLIAVVWKAHRSYLRMTLPLLGMVQYFERIF